MLPSLLTLIGIPARPKLRVRKNFRATEQPNAVYSVEPADRFAKPIYLLAPPVADHLVDRSSDWPGASSLGWPSTRRREYRGNKVL